MQFNRIKMKTQMHICRQINTRFLFKKKNQKHTEQKTASSNWSDWMNECRRIYTDSHLLPWTKLNSKWTKDLKLKQETLNLIKEEVRESLELDGTWKDFLHRTLLTQALKSVIKEEYLMKLKKLKSFCTAKNTIIQTKGQPTEWGALGRLKNFQFMTFF